MDAVHSLSFADWTPAPGVAEALEYTSLIEQGNVLYLPQLRFEFEHGEERFLTPDWLDGSSKSVYLKGKERQLRGTSANGHDREALQAMVERFGRQSLGLVHRLFPGYVPHLTLANTSFRPCEAAGRKQSWRHDDTRLHTDAFPSQPMQGKRILRVFANVHPTGKPRLWRIGEPFAQMAERFLPHVSRPLPGLSWLMAKLRVTKTLRTEYDHIMLRFHDLQKADLEYQRKCPQQSFPFPPGCTWICFSDQVLHAVMEGQFLFEQTFHLPVAGQQFPQHSPLQVLEQLMGRRLAA
jgi:hypothetical protein